MLDTNFYKNKVVLVTGHTGFKGSWLCKMLINFGAKVVGYSLKPPTEPNLYTLANIDNKMTSIIGDIRDFDKLLNIFKTFKPEIVFHLAAQPIVRDSYKEPRYTYETNVMGTVNVLECARLVGCVKSLLNVTTDKVYLNNDIKDHAFKEDEPLDGYDPYSNSKSCSELVTHSYIKSFFNDGKCSISTARAGNEDIVVRNPFSTRPYQHVLEPLYLYLLIAEKQYNDNSYAGFYNIGPDDCDCVNTGVLVTKFCDKWGNNIKWINKYDGGPHEASFLKLDNSLVKKVFDWSPRWHIDECILKIVEWTKIYFTSPLLISQIMDDEINDFLGK